MFVTDINGQSELLIDHSPPQIREVLNGEYGLTFDIYLTPFNREIYDMVVEESIVTCGGQQFTIKGIDETTVGAGAYKSITAEHIFFTLIDFRIMQEEYYDEEVELPRLMQLFKDNGFNVTYSQNFGTKYIEDVQPQNHLEFINYVCQLFKVEVIRDNKNITFVKQQGNQSDEPYRYGYNIKTLSRSVSTDNLSTIIYGYMDGDMDTVYKYQSPLYDVYGPKIAEPVIADDIFEESELMQLLKDTIQDYPDVSYTIDVSGNTHNIGDTAFIVWEPLSIDIKARIVEITKFPEGGGDDIVTISNVSKNSVQILAEFGKTKQNVDKIITTDGHVRFAAMDEQVQKSTHAIINSMTELEYPDNGGIVGRSKLDPLDYTIFNSSGFGIFKDGMLTEAITVDGFNLTAGVIGKLQAQNIATEQLIVGDNITMGPNAVISWQNVGNKPAIPTTPGDIGAMATDKYIDANGVFTAQIYANNIDTVNGKIQAGQIATEQLDIPHDATDIGAMPTATYIDASGIFTGQIYVNKLTGGLVQANQIATTQLIVGDNIAMGPNAKISWGNINNAPTIPTTAAEVGAMATATYIDANNMFTGNLYAYKITGGLIQANQIATSQLIVGNNVSMGSNAYISWSNVYNQPWIPTTASQIGAMPTSTYIDSSGVFTGQVYASKIQAGTISGVSITGGSLQTTVNSTGSISVSGNTLLAKDNSGNSLAVLRSLSASHGKYATFYIEHQYGGTLMFGFDDASTTSIHSNKDLSIYSNYNIDIGAKKLTYNNADLATQDWVKANFTAK